MNNDNIIMSSIAGFDLNFSFFVGSGENLTLPKPYDYLEVIKHRLL